MKGQKNAGFTIIEIIITLTIMALLTTIVVVSLRTSRGAAEDRERKDDVASIARGLESFYKKSNPGHSYPTTSGLAAAIEAEEVEPAALKAPGDDGATAPLYSLGTGTYDYQPFNTDGNPCVSNSDIPCTRFEIHYPDNKIYESINR